MNYDIYVGNATERFALGRSASKKLFVIGVNPSTADASASDQTIRKVEGFANRWDHGGFVMLNLYPQRCTNPKELHRDRDAVLCRKNVKTICELLREEKNPVVWAAWGNLVGKRAYLLDCLSSIVKNLEPQVISWRKYGSLTILDHPRHPSRPGYGENLSIFNIEDYLQRHQSRLADRAFRRN